MGDELAKQVAANWQGEAEAVKAAVPGLRWPDEMSFSEAVLHEFNDLRTALETCAQLLENLHGRQLLLSSTLGGHVTLNFEDAVADARAALAGRVKGAS